VTARICLPICTYDPVMFWTRKRIDPQSELVRLKVLAFDAAVLEDNAARAGAALGCSYSNSNEYEAELIAERLEAGIYGPKSLPWKMRIAAIAAGLCAVVALIILFT
jgi:hypothetical protein